MPSNDSNVKATNTPFNDAPEDLVRLRTTVRDWVITASSAVASFRRKDSSFWLNSKTYESGQIGQENEDDHVSLTSTARSYMALANADRCLDGKSKIKNFNWIKEFKKFIARYKDELKFDDHALKEIYYKKNKKNNNVQTNFDIVHLADFCYVVDYIERFHRQKNNNNSVREKESLIQVHDTLLGFLTNIFSEEKGFVSKLKFGDEYGQLRLENSTQSSPHFFITLHSLRAISILNKEKNNCDIQPNQLSEATRKFCVEQCFYFLRSMQHQQDVFRHTFAGVIYCLYADRVDKDICAAIIEAVSVAQQSNGSWPATHPIHREGHRPWHITSHEIALCLTWLYFQPRVPDSARLKLLEMMERYFLKWVVPTFVSVSMEGSRVLKGWFDDHTIERDFCASWTTAIVCHFLANYHAVLDDHINRRVIETLGLEASSSKFLVDETEHEKSSRWRKPSEEMNATEEGPWRPTWPDIAPFAWSTTLDDEEQVAQRIRSKWTDPEFDDKISNLLSKKVVAPIGRKPGARPDANCCVGLLPGAPGTRKTSLIKTLADILEWPLVTVPASVIFEHGFDMMEARANEVFRRLNYLSSCIIFFDEFEEFFRDREGSESSIHNRTIAAFTTSAMLPRLQELHDEGRCLIFLATNDEGTIDQAIKRMGRFDYRLVIEHPKRKRILQYLHSPTWRTWEDLDFTVDKSDGSLSNKHDEKYKILADAVTDAVNDLFDEGDEIRFRFIEDALKDVKIAAGKQKKFNKKNLVKEAMVSLQRSRRHAENSWGGPPDLKDL